MELAQGKRMPIINFKSTTLVTYAQKVAKVKIKNAIPQRKSKNSVDTIIILDPNHLNSAKSMKFRELPESQTHIWVPNSKLNRWKKKTTKQANLAWMVIPESMMSDDCCISASAEVRRPDSDLGHR
ncbi:hypothetical protein Pyn_18732 [Prunus yedoensis var. nudiflora]|uniref:Uncharacterized protein n=1 Tax=Prunus yedoensis var. nudiflora TaxID=2094558 RepID=A0A314XUU4_PRUYE|nr:hypothetical protein Pyn_04142 [Prunus yedoensis var. nudiflora]PQP96549.1 hypothetical protein Pyn_38213 [Prunus yedoensis var. nudiflora]PQQ10869.1 hypothetical protein Pyn_18732 [Prunus yedoensis var. nudiflora]